jgi:hypothetical protein
MVRVVVANRFPSLIRLSGRFRHDKTQNRVHTNVASKRGVETWRADKRKRNSYFIFLLF